jgi:D-lyxose ketol-isomerase
LKRSEVNKAISAAISFFSKANFTLPPYAYWNKNQWMKYKPEAEEIIKLRLSWDVTDFGSDNFSQVGRTIFTLRNGVAGSKKYKKTYAQKAAHMREGQKSPIHYHERKMEDIINHFGGNIIIRLWKKTPSNKLSKTSVECSMDGLKQVVKPGTNIKLRPGQSIYIAPLTYHQFWAEKGHGDTMSFEISSPNNDLDDNFWLEARNRFPKIDEDVLPKYILSSEYNNML